MENRIKHILALLPALVVFVYFALQLNFIQDDAYISYRYVENFLNGDGLVYNIGERVEGFTNFAWVIYLILLAKLGINYILVSQITGYIFGAGVIVLTYLIAGMIFEGRNRWFVLLPTYLVGANISLAYWAQAGLETGAFAFFAMLSLYLFLKRNWFLIFSLAISVWIRPEGAVLTGILIVTEAIITRRIPKFTLRCALTAFIISLPFVFFKIFYYGSIFPNPFFAKTGMRLDHLMNGLEYAGRFFSHYGFYGAGFILTLIFYRKMTPTIKTVWWFAFLYTLYIVLIGGDVLKVHRFFIPIFGPIAVLAALSILFIVYNEFSTITI